MGRMIFDLTDEDREALERLRIAMGARSHAETLRRLIRDHGATVAPPISAPAHKATQAARNRQASEALDAVSKPKAEFKSRLKGQWKAP